MPTQGRFVVLFGGVIAARLLKVGLGVNLIVRVAVGGRVRRVYLGVGTPAMLHVAGELVQRIAALIARDSWAFVLMLSY